MNAKEKTIGDIMSEYSAKAVALMNARSARVGEITALRTPVGDPYLLERVPVDERNRLLLEQKVELAEQNRNELQREYRAAHADYKTVALEREAHLKRRLFGVESPKDAGLIAQ